jgi:hypothetical protein
MSERTEELARQVMDLTDRLAAQERQLNALQGRVPSLERAAARRARLSTMRALAIGTAAIVLSAAGAAIALPGTNTVDSGDIVDGQVRNADIANGQVGGRKVTDRSLGGIDVLDNSLTGADLNEATLSLVDTTCQPGIIRSYAEINAVGGQAFIVPGRARSCSGKAPQVSRVQAGVYVVTFPDDPSREALVSSGFRWLDEEVNPAGASNNIVRWGFEVFDDFPEEGGTFHVTVVDSATQELVDGPFTILTF